MPAKHRKKPGKVASKVGTADVSIDSKRRKKLDQAARALLGLPGLKRKGAPTPTAKDLRTRFVMRIDPQGKARIIECEDD